jgi:hypothetical protein
MWGSSWLYERLLVSRGEVFGSLDCIAWDQWGVPYSSASWKKVTHFILNKSKLAHRIYVILIANKELIKTMFRAVAQPVDGFPPRRPCFKSVYGYKGFMVDKVALGRFLTKYFCFPATHSTTAPPSSSSGNGTIAQMVTDIQNGLSFSSLQESKKWIKLRI